MNQKLEKFIMGKLLNSWNLELLLISLVKDGLVHVSQISTERVAHPKDLLKEGQQVKVKLIGFDDRGKVRLSMKTVDQKTGDEIPNNKA